MPCTTGQRLRHYEVLDCLGVGGMGEVYRGRDTKLGRDVAIKVIRAERDDDSDFLSRFNREARLLAQLSHPHIAVLYDLDEADDVRFLVMELVNGPTLAERLREGPLSVEESCRLAGQLADALEVAHEKGIIHRDLKPANLKLTERGKLKVLDFGLAKLLPTAPPLSPVITQNTGEGMVLGTPAYMSPEQARGHTVDARTDVWAFGCVLFEMLTAHRAFPGQRLTETLAAVLERDPDWSLLPAGTPPQVRAVLERCLRKNQDHRPRDMRDVRVELEIGSTVLWNTGAASPPSRTVPPPLPPAATLVSEPPALTISEDEEPPTSLPPTARSANGAAPAGVSAGTWTEPAPEPKSSYRGVVFGLGAVILLTGLIIAFAIWFSRPSAEEVARENENDPFRMMNRFHDESWKMFKDFVGKAEQFGKH